MTGLTMDILRIGKFAKGTAFLTTFMFSFVFYFAPLGEVVAREVNTPVEKIELLGTPEQKMNQGLLKLQEIAATKQAKITQRMKDEGGIVDNVLNFIGLSQQTLEDVTQLKILSNLLNEQHTQSLANFAKTEQQLIEKALPDQILQRHRDTVTQYQASYTDMQQRLQVVLQADSLQAQKKAADALNTLMSQQKLKRTHQKVNPDNLPWGTPDAKKTRKPAKTAEELHELTGISRLQQSTQLATNAVPLSVQSGIPVAEDLAQTPDIKITEAIRTLAKDELKSDPLAIYNWVRNNIEFIPSYGSIQGADYTLQSRKGNAFDTSSLLIALFRASNIPARYAYGTVEIPVEKVMNWVGGVDVPEAAQQLLGQGGIPNVALIRGGKVTHIEMEHIWVEAWVDYFPSRAAKHNIGDQWIPLDASFKQYEFTEGENLKSNVPFDAQSLMDQISQSATINETEGYIQGVDKEQVEAALASYQQQIEDYIKNQNPDSTVGEVLGTQKVIVWEFQQLAASLPYKLIARTNNYSELPNNLRHKFRYTLGTEYFGTENSRLITFEQSLPELAGKKHALSFQAASQADQDLINSYLPEPDPTTSKIDPSQLPNELPGYLINLTAEFTQNGKVIHSAAVGTMGGELYETLALWSPTFGWTQAINHPVAGEYRAIGLDLQGVNPEEAAKLQADVEATKAILTNGNTAQIEILTKNEIVGDLLYSAIYSYLIVNNIQDQLQAKASDIINYRLPSYGLFSIGLQTSYWFGLPRNVNISGLVMDVDRLAFQGVAKNNDSKKKTNFVLASGARASALEHLIPEKMFSTQENPAQGISAVKALSIANTEGQRIWTIDQNNLNEALDAINLSSEIENEIRNAVLAGKIATAHEKPINFAGGTNTGYLLIDPDTGAGAYLIAGGTNGGFITAFLITVLAVLGSLALISGGFVAVGVAIFLWEIFNFFSWIDTINNASNATQFNQANASQALVGALGLLLIPGIGGAAIATLLFGIGFSWMLTNTL